MLLRQNRVATVVDGYQDAGVKSVTFSATGGSAIGGNASHLASGVYFYRLVTNGAVQVRKMVMAK